MVILSGIDIVKNSRIKKMLLRSPQALRDIFSEVEIEYCSRKKFSEHSYGARFAAKEALLKATDSHILRYNLSDIEVKNSESGKPSMHIKSEELIVKIQNLLGKSEYSITISLSHEKDYSVASIIIY